MACAWSAINWLLLRLCGLGSVLGVHDLDLLALDLGQHHRRVGLGRLLRGLLRQLLAVHVAEELGLVLEACEVAHLGQRLAIFLDGSQRIGGTQQLDDLFLRGLDLGEECQALLVGAPAKGDVGNAVEVGIPEAWVHLHELTAAQSG